MGGQEITYLILIVIFVGLTAFFCSSEIAFMGLQKVRLEHLVTTRVRGARRVARMVEKPERILSVVLFGNTLVNTAAATLMTALAVNAWGDNGIWISTIIITVVILIFAETTPKTYAAQHSEKVALAFIEPLRLAAWIFTPFVVVLSWLAAGIAGAFGRKRSGP